MKTAGDPRVAVVAGVGPSVGRAVAVRLARDGWRVVAAGRHAGHVAAACAEIEAAGGAAVPLATDLADPAWLTELAGHGPVDAAVWVASAYAPFARIGLASVEAFDQVHATTLRGPFLLARAVVPTMCARRFGRFLALGSAAGSHGGVGQAAYASAKAGLVGLIRTIAAEGGPSGVTANLVELGYVDTERTRTLSPEVRAGLVARCALRRPATPEEVAGIVAFLVSDASAYLTGARLPVDGGLGVGL